MGDPVTWTEWHFRSNLAAFRAGDWSMELGPHGKRVRIASRDHDGNGKVVCMGAEETV